MQSLCCVREMHGNVKVETSDANGELAMLMWEMIDYNWGAVGVFVFFAALGPPRSTAASYTDRSGLPLRNEIFSAVRCSAEGTRMQAARDEPLGLILVNDYILGAWI